MQVRSLFRHLAARLGCGLCMALAVLACGDTEAPSQAPEADTAAPDPSLYEMKNGIWVPRADAPYQGLPDTCDFLSAADPAALLGAELAPAERYFGLCIIAAKGSQTLDQSAGIELRRASESGVPTDEEQFWAAEGAGVEFMGGKREGIEELEGPADYAVWYPIEFGLQLNAYWGGEYILVVNVRGAPIERALPWAREIVQTAVQATTAQAAPPAPGS